MYPVLRGQRSSFDHTEPPQTTAEEQTRRVNTLISSGLGELSDIVQYMRMEKIGPHNYFAHHSLIYGCLCTAYHKIEVAGMASTPKSIQDIEAFSAEIMPLLTVQHDLESCISRLGSLNSGPITAMSAFRVVSSIDEIRSRLAAYLAEKKGFIIHAGGDE